MEWQGVRKRAKSSCFWGISLFNAEEEEEENKEEEEEEESRESDSGWMRSNSVRRKVITERGAGWWKMER